MRAKFFNAVPLGFGQQIGRMSDRHPGLRVSLARSVATWVGELRPSPIAESYTVRIEYSLRKRPTVWVIRPHLRRRDISKRIPHTFADGSVCLHLHEDWTPQMYIAETIVPWLLLWLYHYEVCFPRGTGMGAATSRTPRNETYPMHRWWRNGGRVPYLLLGRD